MCLSPACRESAANRQIWSSARHLLERVPSERMIGQHGKLGLTRSIASTSFLAPRRVPISRPELAKTGSLSLGSHGVIDKK